jgi:hypothetical protein
MRWRLSAQFYGNHGLTSTPRKSEVLAREQRTAVFWKPAGCARSIGYPVFAWALMQEQGNIREIP